MTVGPSTSVGAGTGTTRTTDSRATNHLTNLLEVEARIWAAASDEPSRHDEGPGPYADDGVPDNDLGETRSDGEDDTEEPPDPGEADPLRRRVPPPEIEFYAQREGTISAAVRLLDTGDPQLDRLTEERFLYLSALARALARLQPAALRADTLTGAYLALEPMTQSGLEAQIKAEGGLAVRERESASRVSRHGRVLVRTAGTLLVPVAMFHWGGGKLVGAGEQERLIAQTRAWLLRQALILLWQDPKRRPVDAVSEATTAATRDQLLALAMDQVRPTGDRAHAQVLRQDPAEWKRAAQDVLRTRSFDMVMSRTADTIRKNHVDEVIAVAAHPDVVEQHRRLWPMTSDTDLAAELGVTKSGGLVCRLALVGIIGPPPSAGPKPTRPIRKGVWR